MEALIVSGGHLEDAFLLSYLQNHKCDLVIAVDSGMNFFYRTGQTPDYIVGDFDSAAPDVLQSFTVQSQINKKKPVILQFQPEKDETDTELAIRTAIEQGCSRIHLLGATGSRMDHVMGNIHLLGMAMKQGVECLMTDEHNRIRMIQKGIVIQRKEQYGDYISLFPFTPQVKGLTLTGFKYPLDGYSLECYHSLGVSNEITGEQAEISFEEGVLLVMESKD
ncbi:MAG: thiamine diphosphokinase [Lachnospiraceae bacterium]|nr:thiamine diphosphokinase [Lachnospiraceae bacterium]